MNILARMQVKGRIAYSLLSLKSKFGVTSDGQINIILSRQDLPPTPVPLMKLFSGS
jgi:hypothetical protein